MKKQVAPLLSRREFAQRAAVFSATASLAPAGLVLPEVSADSADPPAEDAPKLSPEGQIEADSRYQQILSLYGSRLTEAQKSDIKRMCAELQPSLERIRTFNLQNGDAPALYLKPLVERGKKSASAPKSQPAGSLKKS
jgi:hypothetical protein